MAEILGGLFPAGCVALFLAPRTGAGDRHGLSTQIDSDRVWGSRVW